MYTRRTTIINKSGLHARPAMDFVAQAKTFKSKIKIMNLNSPEDGALNGKSIITVLSLAMGPGTPVEISAEGEDEILAVDSLIELIDSGFGE